MRKPDYTVGNYLSRWHLIPRNGFGNIYFHRFVESDAPVCHDHPWWNISILLRGRYREHYHDGTYRDFGAGSIIFRQAHKLHWLEVLDGPVYTLFLTGSRRRRWGFMTSTGWVDYEKHDPRATDY